MPDPTRTSEVIARYWPVTLGAVTVISMAVGIQFQVGAQASEIEDHGYAIEENEEQINQIQQLLIRRAGEQQLSIQQLQNDIERQGEKAEENGRKLDTLIRQLQRLEGQ